MEPTEQERSRAWCCQGERPGKEEKFATGRSNIKASACNGSTPRPWRSSASVPQARDERFMNRERSDDGRCSVAEEARATGLYGPPYALCSSVGVLSESSVTGSCELATGMIPTRSPKKRMLLIPRACGRNHTQ